MKHRIFITLSIYLIATSAMAQKYTVQSIRERYNAIHEVIQQMTPDKDGETMLPKEYIDLDVYQNLPGTGGHNERIRLWYGYLEDGDDVIYPPRYLSFATSKYNYAAREFYEEYLYDEKGNLLFVYAKTPDVEHSDMYPFELRLWFDGKQLLRFNAKNHEGKEVYKGTKIPENFQSEVNRVKDRGIQLLEMFKGLDKAVLL